MGPEGVVGIGLSTGFWSQTARAQSLAPPCYSNVLPRNFLYKIGVVRAPTSCFILRNKQGNTYKVLRTMLLHSEPYTTIVSISSVITPGLLSPFTLLIYGRTKRSTLTVNPKPRFCPPYLS